MQAVNGGSFSATMADVSTARSTVTREMIVEIGPMKSDVVRILLYHRLMAHAHTHLNYKSLW